MAASRNSESAADKAGRGVTRTILNGLVIGVSLAILGAWAWQGIYWLEPGESAVILRLGAYDRTREVEGLAWHLPPPLESHEVVNTSRLRTESFGTRATRSTPGLPTDAEESEIAREIQRDAIQTADSNIVNVAYELQYSVGDAYAYRFSMADPGAILHDATEAAMRSVVGRRSIDDVLSQDRDQIAREAAAQLEGLLAAYVTEVGHEAAFDVRRINLEKPQAPEPVREAFADVVSAGQDEKRSSLEATGDAREIVQRAQSEAAEIREQAEAYKRARIIEATGEAARFEALLVEYQGAPQVTRKRLYLETMEEILPGVEKIVIEPDTVNMLPMLPLGRGGSAVGGGAMRFFFTLLVVGAIVVAALWAAQYDSGPIVINRADEYRLVLRFGEPVAELTEAGIARADYFGVAEGPFIRLPFMDEVLVFDKRIQYLNAAASEIEIGGNERLIVDYYALWRIDSPLAFRRSFPGGVAEARERIQRTVGALVGAAVGNLTMGELLSRAEVLESLDEQASEQLSPNGVRVVEVRINRTELPLPTETATFEQMREQRRAISREKRAIGERQAREIRAKAEREARELVAEARAQAEVVRGEGDAESARIYAGAYGRDPDFYAFVRSLEAYRKTLKQNTTLVVPPDHEFFRFLDEPARAR